MNIYSLHVTPRLLERFWSHVQKDHGCWTWTGGTTGKKTSKWRYGIFWTGVISHHARYITSHKASWIIHFGDIPHGAFVCHHCDNTLCVRPDHLWLGTAKENTADMVKKGRQHFWTTQTSPRGDYHPRSKLSTRDAEAIKRSPQSSAVLASRYRVNWSTVDRIRKGTSWKHLQ